MFCCLFLTSWFPYCLNPQSTTDPLESLTRFWVVMSCVKARDSVWCGVCGVSLTSRYLIMSFPTKHSAYSTPSTTGGGMRYVVFRGIFFVLCKLRGVPGGLSPFHVLNSVFGSLHQSIGPPLCNKNSARGSQYRSESDLLALPKMRK